VSHGRVLYVAPGRMLRMEAPFGPLQGLGAYTVWTITISLADGGGATVVFDEVATARPPPTWRRPPRPSTTSRARQSGAW
jgi:hypothetical protein